MCASRDRLRLVEITVQDNLTRQPLIWYSTTSWLSTLTRRRLYRYSVTGVTREENRDFFTVLDASNWVQAAEDRSKWQSIRDAYVRHWILNAGWEWWWMDASRAHCDDRDLRMSWWWAKTFKSMCGQINELNRQNGRVGQTLLIQRDQGWVVLPRNQYRWLWKTVPSHSEKRLAANVKGMSG